MTGSHRVRDVVGEHGLCRARLLDRLPRRRLAVLVAPAGTGKTTLLRQHTAAVEGVVVWHRAEPADADETLFASRLTAAVGRHAGVATGADLLDAVGALQSQPLTIVVDDAQALVGTGAATLVERLLTDGPPTLSIIMASRREPELILCRAEVGPVTLVTADDLRFRSWETEQLFRDVYHEPLPPDDIATLTRRTEGWAAGLQLFHLSTLSRPLAERRRAVAALSGRSRFARTYLVRTILDTVPTQLRAFLARTAVFEVLTARRCDALLDRTDAQTNLEELERLAAFTTSDDGGHTFRYHEVLRRHLESALHDELGPEATRDWFARAAAILEDEPAPSEAVRAWARAERWVEVTRLMRADGARVIADAGAVWPDLLPPRLIDEDPWLSLAVGRRLAMEGRLAAARLRYRHAEALFPDDADRERAAHERRLVELWSEGSPRPGLHWLDRIRAAVHRRPCDVCDDPANTAGDRLGLAIAALLTGDLAAAGRALEAVSQEADSALALVVRLVQGVVGLAAGTYGATVDRLAVDAERAGMSWVARQARLLDAVHTGAADEITRIVAECDSTDDSWGALLARAGEAWRRLVSGDPARAAWDDVTERCQALQASTPAAWAAAAGALAAAAQGDPDAAATARSAEHLSRVTGVWGAQSLAVLALAVANPQGRDGTLRQARALAAANGVPWPGTLVDRLLGPAPAGAVAQDPPVTLRCLGSFGLEIEGRSLQWATLRPRAAATLRLLAAHSPEPVHRETLLMLWPGAAPPAATHSLQVAISALRGFLTPEARRGEHRLIRREGDTYRLALPSGSDSDVTGFRTALADAAAARRTGDAAAERTALAAGVDRYTGALLPDDGPAEWVVELRERLRVDAALAAGRLAELALAAGDPRACIAAAQRSIQIDPYCDSSWRLLVDGHTRTNDPAAAAQARHAYREVLAELGLAPAGPRPERPDRSFRHVPVDCAEVRHGGERRRAG